jgi:hypothetical protein
MEFSATPLDGDDAHGCNFSYRKRDVPAAYSVFYKIIPCDFEAPIFQSAMRHVLDLNSVQRAYAVDGQ